MKTVVLGMIVAVLSVTMLSTNVWAEDASKVKKDKSTSVSGTLALVKNDKGETTGLTLTTKNGAVTTVDMSGSTQDVSTLNGKDVVAKGEVNDVDGKVTLKIKEEIRLAAGATGPLGDLGSFRKIAEDTLVLVEKNDLAAAKKRITDLETAWDKAEEHLRKLNQESWTSVDKSIDRALAQLRSGKPNAAACAASLKTLIAKFDSVGKAPAK